MSRACIFGGRCDPGLPGVSQKFPTWRMLSVVALEGHRTCASRRAGAGKFALAWGCAPARALPKTSGNFRSAQMLSTLDHGPRPTCAAEGRRRAEMVTVVMQTAANPRRLL